MKYARIQEILADLDEIEKGKLPMNGKDPLVALAGFVREILWDNDKLRDDVERLERISDREPDDGY